MACFDTSGAKQEAQSYLPEQKKWMQTALAEYGPSIGAGQPSYQGQRVAEFTPEQKAALSGLPGLLETFEAGRPMPMYPETGAALKGILSGETGAETITPQMTGDYFSRVFEKPAAYQFQEHTRPLIREEYAGPGFWGSARAKAVTKAGQEMGDWLGEQRGGLEWQVGEANRAIAEAKAGRAAAAVPMGMQYGQMPTQEAGARLAGRQGVFGFAGAEQQQQQMLISSAIQKYQEGQRLTDPEKMGIIMNLLGMTYQSSSGSEWGAGLGYTATGALASSFGKGFGETYGASVAASDKRKKENIKPIKSALDKLARLKGYVFNFIGDNKKNAGVMAQDVERVLPEGVVEIGGVKHIKLDAVIALIVDSVNDLRRELRGVKRG